jgi:hypothetical protein
LLTGAPGVGINGADLNTKSTIVSGFQKTVCCRLCGTPSHPHRARLRRYRYH